MKSNWAIPVIASILILGVIGLGEDAWAPTKIVPPEGAPGHPFTIIDTPDARLVDGAIAIFTGSGVTAVVPLVTNPTSNTAQGIVPDLPIGDYDVSFESSTCSNCKTGMFRILGKA